RQFSMPTSPWPNKKARRWNGVRSSRWSPREDLGTLEQKFKKNYLDEKHTSEEMEVKIGQWETLLRQIFIRKR
ncbi:MAG TPA: hypothetical protein VGA27_05705, partial [Candidatus Binatia bacterium]